jgi:hypothetical protein
MLFFVANSGPVIDIRDGVSMIANDMETYGAAQDIQKFTGWVHTYTYRIIGR